MTRVLIVEDEPDLADPLAYLLRREGFEVEIAEGVRGAACETLGIKPEALMEWIASKAKRRTLTDTHLAGMSTARSLSRSARSWLGSAVPRID